MSIGSLAAPVKLWRATALARRPGRLMRSIDPGELAATLGEAANGCQRGSPAAVWWRPFGGRDERQLPSRAGGLAGYHQEPMDTCRRVAVVIDTEYLG